MIWIIRMLVLAVAWVGSPLQAQDLSAADRARLVKDPTAFLEVAATATHWFGDPRGLNAQGVEDYVAAARAGKRADAMAALLRADLSGDGTVTLDEVARLAPSLSPGPRGKLIAAEDRADADHDGKVTPAELTRFAQGEALRLFPDQKAHDLRLILLFDVNADGWVSFDEVVQKLKDMAA
jgi:hypothetical protein